MKIINPLYDYAFKYLMDNNRIAKKVLSTLLECEVLELSVEQQEIVAVNQARELKLYRLDFSAIILDEHSNKQKVLIELQKSKLPTNALRFRTYLGESYTKRELIINSLGLEEEKAYPIISIYILGYNVVDIPYLSISIDNKIRNTVTREEVEVNSDFIDLLTHKARIIQIRRLAEKRKSRLEQFLMLFNQAYITSERFILDLDEIPEAFSDVANYLSGPVQDEAFRNQLKGEEEIDMIFNNQEAELARAKDELEQSKEELLKEQQEKEAALQKIEKLQNNQIEIARHLLQTGMETSKITNLTGLKE